MVCHSFRQEKKHNYSHENMANTNEFMVDKKGTKSVTVKTTGNEKFCVTLICTALANGRKLPPYVILK